MLIRLLAARQFDEVVRRASRLLEAAPSLAEAWNQRGTAHYALGQFAETIRDCHEALELNPYHFIAATHMGRAYLELGNPGVGPGVFSPGVAAQSRPRRRAAPGRPPGPPGRRR